MIFLCFVCGFFYFMQFAIILTNISEDDHIYLKNTRIFLKENNIEIKLIHKILSLFIPLYPVFLYVFLLNKIYKKNNNNDYIKNKKIEDERINKMIIDSKLSKYLN